MAGTYSLGGGIASVLGGVPAAFQAAEDRKRRQEMEDQKMEAQDLQNQAIQGQIEDTNKARKDQATEENMSEDMAVAGGPMPSGLSSGYVSSKGYKRQLQSGQHTALSSSKNKTSGEPDEPKAGSYTGGVDINKATPAFVLKSANDHIARFSPMIEGMSRQMETVRAQLAKETDPSRRRVLLKSYIGYQSQIRDMDDQLFEAKHDASEATILQGANQMANAAIAGDVKGLQKLGEQLGIDTSWANGMWVEKDEKGIPTNYILGNGHKIAPSVLEVLADPTRNHAEQEKAFTRLSTEIAAANKQKSEELMAVAKNKSAEKVAGIHAAATIKASENTSGITTAKMMALNDVSYSKLTDLYNQTKPGTPQKEELGRQRDLIAKLQHNLKFSKEGPGKEEIAGQQADRKDIAITLSALTTLYKSPDTSTDDKPGIKVIMMKLTNLIEKNGGITPKQDAELSDEDWGEAPPAPPIHTDKDKKNTSRFLSNGSADQVIVKPPEPIRSGISKLDSR